MICSCETWYGWSAGALSLETSVSTRLLRIYPTDLPFGDLDIRELLQRLYDLVLPRVLVHPLLSSTVHGRRCVALQRAQPAFPEALALDGFEAATQTLLARDADEDQ